MSKRTTYTVYCQTCQRNFYTYVWGRGVQKYTRKTADKQASIHLRLWPAHVVTVKEKA